MDALPIKSNYDAQVVAEVAQPNKEEDPETRPAVWLCVLGAFLFLVPSYGKTAKSFARLFQSALACVYIMFTPSSFTLSLPILFPCSS